MTDDAEKKKKPVSMWNEGSRAALCKEHARRRKENERVSAKCISGALVNQLPISRPRLEHQHRTIDRLCHRTGRPWISNGPAISG